MVECARTADWFYARRIMFPTRLFRSQETIILRGESKRELLLVLGQMKDGGFLVESPPPPLRRSS